MFVREWFHALYYGPKKRRRYPLSKPMISQVDLKSQLDRDMDRYWNSRKPKASAMPTDAPTFEAVTMLLSIYS
jgi:hypothetical protein